MIQILKNAELFRGISADRIDGLLSELRARKRLYQAGATVHSIGDCLDSIGLVLRGEVQMVSEDFWGNKGIVMSFYPGEFYGEAHSITHEPMFFDIVAREDTAILLIDPMLVLAPGPEAAEERRQLQQNMISIIAQKKISYMHEIDYLMRRSIREKLLAFLSEQARQMGTSSFYIPYNRQQLSEHLAVDRSALSRELSKMQAEGILQVKRNYFVLL